MRLTVHTDYALRMLIYLATHDGRQATIAEVADRYGISQHHLTKVAHQLGQAGFIATTRGKGGGLRLGRDPAEISLGAVVRFSEPDMDLVPCFNQAEGAGCAIAPACGLPSILDQARGAFLGVLDRHSLADVVRDRRALGRLLGIAPPREAAAG